MANITGEVTVDEASLLEVDGDPAAGAGTEASISSIAVYNDGAAGHFYLKYGALDTDWAEFVPLANHHTNHEADGVDPLNLSKVLGKQTVFVDAAYYPTIQDAIDYAETLNESWHPSPAAGDPVLGVAVVIPAGHFDEDVVIRKTISLIGRGKGVTSIKSVTSRPPEDLVFTGDTTNLSHIVTNVSINTNQLYVGAVFDCPSAFATPFAVDTIDSPTQFHANFGANNTVVGATFTIAVNTGHQALIGLTVYEMLTVSNETASGSGIYKNHLAGETDYVYGLTVESCLIFAMEMANIGSLNWVNSELYSAATILNVGGEISNSLLQGNFTVQVDDTHPGFSAGGGTNIYMDTNSVIGAVLYEKPAGSTPPTGGLTNTFFYSFSDTGGGGVSVDGVGYNPAVPANWLTPPTETSDALDEIVARLVAGGL